MLGTGNRQYIPALLCVAATVACNPESSLVDAEPRLLSCTIPAGQIYDGGPGVDAIPALNNPPLVGAQGIGLEYLQDDDRVIGVLWNGQAIAVPHRIGWWHEIVNFDLEGLSIAITYCPLTGSSLAFDRSAAGGVTFGVSGLLYQNNLIMYDRNRDESLWPQMARGARCGARTGAQLTMIPVVEMEWGAWRGLHPDTRVVSGDLNLGRNYNVYPYGDYNQLDNVQLLHPVEDLDRRRPLKERVLGVPGAAGGVAFPFGELAEQGDVALIRGANESGDYVVLWAEQAGAAMAFRPVAAGRALTLEVRAGAFVDLETSSTWDVDGVARSGELRGERLQPVAEAHVAFWFAWAAFNRDTEIWTATP